MSHRYPVRQPDATPVYPDGVQHPVWVPEFPFTPDVGDYIMMTGGWASL